VFPKIGVPPNHPIFNRVFHDKPSIFGGNTPIFGNTQLFLAFVSGWTGLEISPDSKIWDFQGEGA